MNGAILVFFLLLQAPETVPPHARFSGRIVDGETGCDLRGLVNFVRLSGKIPENDITVLTKRNGWYEAGVLRPGRYRIVAVSPGYRPSIQEVDVPEIPAWHPLDFSMRKGESITIHVRDPAGKMIDGAWATLSYLGGTKGGAGEWSILQLHAAGDTARSREGLLRWDGLPPGRWRIRLSKPGYLPRILETKAGERRAVLERGRLVILTVENGDGTPAPDVLVNVFAEGRAVSSGISGAYGDMAITLVPGENELTLHRLPGGRIKMKRRVTVSAEGMVDRITIRWSPP